MPCIRRAEPPPGVRLAGQGLCPQDPAQNLPLNGDAPRIVCADRLPAGDSDSEASRLNQPSWDEEHDDKETILVEAFETSEEAALAFLPMIAATLRRLAVVS